MYFTRQPSTYPTEDLINFGMFIKYVQGGGLRKFDRVG